jgi:hypothetical protein
MDRRSETFGDYGFNSLGDFCINNLKKH